MAAGFGFQNNLMPQMVGGMLGAQGMPAGSAPPQEPPPDLPPQDGPPDVTGALDPAWPSQSKAALQEAIQRAMNPPPPAQNPKLPNPAHQLQLIQLGIPAQDAQLLTATGGSNS